MVSECNGMAIDLNTPGSTLLVTEMSHPKPMKANGLLRIRLFVVHLNLYVMLALNWVLYAASPGQRIIKSSFWPV